MSELQNSKEKLSIIIIIGVVLIVLTMVLTYKSVNTSYVVNDNISTVVLNDELVTIDFAHEKVHDGEHYFIRNFTDIPNGGDFEIHLMTSEMDVEDIHMIIQVENNVETIYTLLENVTIIENGTRLNYFNRNRNSGDDNCVDLFFDPTYSDGEVIAENKLGSGKKFGGQERDANELILLRNTSYVLLIENNADGAVDTVNYVLDWYEDKIHIE